MNKKQIWTNLEYEQLFEFEQNSEYKPIFESEQILNLNKLKNVQIWKVFKVEKCLKLKNVQTSKLFKVEKMFKKVKKK
jgi:hypothetical protein